MGYLRYFLSILVLFSHYGVLWQGKNQGISAVIVFLIISGFVITKLINKNYCSLSSIKSFYLDRALRIYPQFLFYLFLFTLILVSYGEISFIDDLDRILINASMIPINFYAKSGLWDIYIIPPAWSLGLEFQFYLILPFLLLFKLRKYFFICSVLFFIFPFTGILNSDYFGYRLLPATLAMFLFGSFMATYNIKAVLFGYFFYLILFILCIFGNFNSYPNIEVLSGIIIGVPLFYLLSKVRKNNVDFILGNISYGVYLNHMLVLFFIRKYEFDSTSPVVLLFSIVICSLLSYFSFKLIEVPVYNLRQKIRATSYPVKSIWQNSVINEKI